jgi:hypothetical protein
MSLIVSDLNNDGRPEILTTEGVTFKGPWILGSPGLITVFNPDGTLFSNFPLIDYYSKSEGLVTGDVYGNKAGEIFLSNQVGGSYYRLGYNSRYMMFRIIAIDTNGNIIKGFPKYYHSLGAGYPALDDLDNDKKVEYIYVGGGQILVWEVEDSNTTAAMSWPMFSHDPEHTALYVKKIVCRFPDSNECKANSYCSCEISNCNTGWIRVRLPDEREFVKYFTDGKTSFNPGSNKGVTTVYISCLDDGKEYSYSFSVV